jgi:hypothetical protein
MSKSPEMEKSLDGLTTRVFGRPRTDALAQEICVTCGGNAKKFKDIISEKEYIISGMCQTCQDEVFSGE